jgi:DNA-binding ferritin-like protein
MAETPRNLLKRDMPSTSTPANNPGIEGLVFELLNAVTKVHINHLRVTGPGSYAAHKAMGDFYDGVGDFADSLAEQWQGITEKLIDYPTTAQIPTMNTAADCLAYLRACYTMCDKIQAGCQYSEICNLIDEIKSLINSTKYKLIFLK